MWNNRNTFNGLSVLPFSDHTYTQAPFETIDEEKFNEMVSHLHAVDLTKVIEFDTVKTKHLRLYYVEAVNNNGSAAEIKLHRADIPADVDGLKDVINKAKAMEDIGYLSTSWNHLQDTIKAAEGLVNAENPNANEIEIMKRQLTDAMVKLVLSVDNEKLKSMEWFDKVISSNKDNDFFSSHSSNYSKPQGNWDF